MARLPRISLPGFPQHIIQRGNNKQATFLDDNDFSAYLKKLGEYATQYHVHVHAYCLMTNHVHLLLTPLTENGTSRLMQALGRYYVCCFNKKYERTGTLWEGRFKSTVVDTDFYFLAVSRYIELNPVKAQMVENPGQYQWSSFRCNAMKVSNGILTPHPCYLKLGSTAHSRASNYQKLFQTPLTTQQDEEIKQATDKAWVLGDEKFKTQVEQLTNRRASPIPKGGDRKSAKN